MIGYSGLEQDNRLGEVGEITWDRLHETDSRVNRFRATLHDYLKQCGLQLNSVERRNIQVGRAIIKNSIFEEDFWQRTKETRQFLEIVVDTLQYIAAGKTMNERREALDKIIEFLEEAEVQHLAVIKPFQLLPPDLQRPDRQRDLLRWNRAARIYAKHSFDLAFEDPDFMSTAEFYRRREALEFCRMLLFAPFDKTTVEGYQEQRLIADANKQLRLHQIYPCMSNLMELALVDCGSLFVEAVEKILGSELIYMRVISTRKSLTGKILTDTYNDTTRAVEMLLPLRSFCDTRLDSNNIKEWVTELDAWIRRANEYLDLCRAAAAALPVVL